MCKAASVRADPPRPSSAPFVLFERPHDHGVIVNGIGDRLSPTMTLIARGLASHVLVGMTDREIEVPEGSGLLDHLIATAEVGGTIYLMRDGVRVAAVVPADVAESLAADGAEGDLDAIDRAGDLAAEADLSNGPVTQDDLDEVDREWRAELGR